MSCWHLTDFWLADGRRNPLKKSELFISDGVIKAVGAGSIGCGAGKKISLKNMVVAPGFIDVHGHSDISALTGKNALAARSSQGVTCEIAGNCGLSAFPATPENIDHLEKLYAKYEMKFSWRNFSDFRSISAGVCDHLCRMEYLAGHNTLRASVLGYGKTCAGEQDIEKMCRSLDEMLKNGAVGLSLGLLYTPGKFASHDELLRLFKTVSSNRKIVTCHLKSEGNLLLESMQEMFDTALTAGLEKFHISHFKTAGAANFHKLAEAFALIENAEKRGLHITFDRYPYTRSMTQLSLVLPDEWSDIDDVTITAKLRSDELCRNLAAQLRTLRSKEYWQSVILVNTSHSSYRSKLGMTLDRLGDDPASCVIDILRHNSPDATAAFSGMSEKNMLEIIRDPRCMAGSDGTALPPDGSLGYDHPRSYGAICRFIRLLLDNGTALQDAVWKVSGLAAETFSLTSAGVICEGNPADIVVFDPDEIDGKADFSHPAAFSCGIKQLMRQGSWLDYWK